MANHFYAYISRMRCVKRWALMRNTEEENIQEHSHMVAVLAHALALIRTRVFGLPTDANAVAVAALYHDATEILTGDMPTPIKYYNPEIRDAYRKVEAVASDKLLSMLPDELRADYEPSSRSRTRRRKGSSKRRTSSRPTSSASKSSRRATWNSKRLRSRRAAR